MKKYIALLFLFFIAIQSQGQNKVPPIKSVDKIFKQYVTLSEGTDSKDDQAVMKTALISLQKSASLNDLEVLIEVWMYYDPTDFLTRDLINPIFIQNKKNALTVINKRLKNKRKSESNESSPYTALVALKNQMQISSTAVIDSISVRKNIQSYVKTLNGNFYGYGNKKFFRKTYNMGMDTEFIRTNDIQGNDDFIFLTVVKSKNCVKEQIDKYILPMNPKSNYYLIEDVKGINVEKIS